MTNLKIDPELRDLLPPLSKEKFEGLEKMILEEGYDGTPILIWNSYIVDGHIILNSIQKILAFQKIVINLMLWNG